LQKSFNQILIEPEELVNREIIFYIFRYVQNYDGLTKGGESKT